ncbi:MAG: hypothetical protein HYX75_11075 [Acidobacteria bacterium]|nr:hypothetical protein [Acidobacteriota bacterium]
MRRSVAAGEVIVTGTGRDAYDLALLVCCEARGSAIVVLDNPRDDVEAPEILPERRLLVFPEDRGMEPAERDLWIGRIADRAWDIFIRTGGNMAELAEALRQRGCPVDPTPVSDTSSPPPTTSGSPRPLPPPPGTAGPWEFLSHYTREPDGAWLGEPRAVYLGWLAHGHHDDHRDAGGALRRILSERTIRASGRLMPGRCPMVSFTALPPGEVGRLMKWRTGLHRWTVRPYGVAVRRAVLEAIGARPVSYLASADIQRLPEAERLFSQKHEPPATDWAGEIEWRLRGDLRLDSIPATDLRLIAPSPLDAERLRAEFGIEAIAIWRQ